MNRTMAEDNSSTDPTRLTHIEAVAIVLTAVLSLIHI